MFMLRLALSNALVVSALLFVPSFRQTEGKVSLPTTPFDEYGNICWEDEQARLDNFAIQIQNDESLIGYIIVYAGRISCSDEAKYRAERARKWVVLKRGIKSDRLVVRDGGYRDDLQTVLHLQPKNFPEYVATPTLRKDQVSIRRCRDKQFAKVICLKRG
jgi:hypothetical protein